MRLATELMVDSSPTLYIPKEIINFYTEHQNQSIIEWSTDNMRLKDFLLFAVVIIYVTWSWIKGE